MMFPLHFHYEDVLRQDLLLKLKNANVMEVPGLCSIRLVPNSDFQRGFGKLAMEMTCGQRFFPQKKGPAEKSFRSGSEFDKESEYVSDFARIRRKTLRGHRMSHFLVRILTVMSLFYYPVEIRENSILFSMETEFCEFSPELEDHFEIFERFNVTIVTSANTKDETLLLWSGFLLKDEGETQ